ncbi:hypothetical protein FB451DRAFT_1485255 [Mycena latifolia]|nr:hypothetical protein FB451DRAFT_1485255 [Mycena latifolia]
MLASSIGCLFSRSMAASAAGLFAGACAIGGLAFVQEGTSVVITRWDGLGAGVWGIRPASMSGGAVQRRCMQMGVVVGIIGAHVTTEDGSRDHWASAGILPTLTKKA